MIALVRDDLATPAALALLWEVVKDEDCSMAEKMGVLEAAEAVFGLSLLTPPQSHVETIPDDILELAKMRDSARDAKNFEKSDELRIHIQDRGYRVDDGTSGTIVTKQ